jgi:16S rRNA (adenine(1408)-N(1))-methyltransferase
MNVVQGKKTSYMTRERLDVLVAQHQGVTVDLGAGDGRFALNAALAAPERLFIAVEQDRAQLADVSARAAKHASRGGVPNVLFVAASARQMPRALDRVADEVLVMLPTGSLLRGILTADPAVIDGISYIGQKGARIKIALSTRLVDQAEREESRTLPDVTPLYTRDIIAPAFVAKGVRVSKARWMEPGELAKLGTSWSRRLAEAPSRTFYIEAKVMTVDGKPAPPPRKRTVR